MRRWGMMSDVQENTRRKRKSSQGHYVQNIRSAPIYDENYRDAGLIALLYHTAMNMLNRPCVMLE